jgi:ubiquinone/menaquinone biosynthesis C-methylase UbiE
MPAMSAIEQAFCRSAPWRGFARQVVLPWALQGVQPIGQVLEVGSGSGDMAEATARTYPEVHVVATDIDPSMVRVARGRLRPYPNAAAVEADVTKLPFEDRSYDVVASFLMLHHVIDWRPALREARRVLKPGGRFIGYDLQRTMVATAVHQLDRSPFALLSCEEVEGGLREAGFVRATVSPGLGHLAMRFTAELEPAVSDG